MKIFNILGKIDLLITRNMISRPDVQAKIVINKLFVLVPNKVNKLIDVGGGDARYMQQLFKITHRYLNLEISKGRNVDIAGSVYDIPIKASTIDIIILLTVLEHLRPCFRS